MRVIDSRPVDAAGEGEDEAHGSVVRLRAIVAPHPLGRIAEAEEISDAILWSGSERSSYVTGVALSADGGYTAGRTVRACVDAPTTMYERKHG